MGARGAAEVHGPAKSDNGGCARMGGATEKEIETRKMRSNARIKNPDIDDTTTLFHRPPTKARRGERSEMVVGAHPGVTALALVLFFAILPRIQAEYNNREYTRDRDLFSFYCRMGLLRSPTGATPCYDKETRSAQRYTLVEISEFKFSRLPETRLVSFFLFTRKVVLKTFFNIAGKSVIIADVIVLRVNM